MASTPTTRNKFRKPAPGDLEDTWGPEITEDVFDRVDQALDGYLTINLSIYPSGTKTLTITDYEDNEYRNRIIKFIGNISEDTTVVVPDLERWWIFDNRMSGDGKVIIANTASTVTLKANQRQLLISDGTNLFDSGFVSQADINTSIATLDAIPVRGTSTTSLDFGLGGKGLVIAETTPRIWGVGQRLRISRRSFSNTSWMTGTVTSYVHPLLTVNVDGFSGSGFVTDWEINISGETGPLSTVDATSIAAEQAIIYQIALGD